MSGMLKVRFQVSEIESEGDVDDSVADLRQAGCQGIEVMYTDFEQEWMLVSCALPQGVKDLNQLQAKLKYACVC